MLAELFLGKRLEPFVYPLGYAPRTAVLVPWFRPPRGTSLLPGSYSPNASIRLFPSGWCGEAEAFAPGAIAATMSQFAELGQAAFGKRAPKLTHAAIVLARPGQSALTESQRDWLWRRFQVPVFEQVIGPNGALLAAECEAHDGLHADPAETLLTGEHFDPSPCPCGRRSPKIRLPQGVELEQRIVAYAR